MSGSIKSIFLGGAIAMTFLGFTACQDSQRGKTKALDGAPQLKSAGVSGSSDPQKNEIKVALKKSCEVLKQLKNSNKASSPEVMAQMKEEEAKIVRINSQGAGSIDAKWMAFNEKLMDQAHGVFVEVWKKLEPDMQKVPTSVFSLTRAHLLQKFSMQNGLPVLTEKESEKSTEKTLMVPVFTRGEDCLPQSLELQVVDRQMNRLYTFAKMSLTTRGVFEWRFNSSVMPEAVGQRLQTLGQDVVCSVKNKGAQLVFLNCLHLGQEGFEVGSSEHKVRVEFDRFFYDLSGKEYTFEGSESRYSDLVNPDATFSKKEIKVQVDLGPIYRKYTKTVKPEEVIAETQAHATNVALEMETPKAVASGLAPEKTQGMIGSNEGKKFDEKRELSATSQGDQRDLPQVKPIENSESAPVAHPEVDVINEK